MHMEIVNDSKAFALLLAFFVASLMLAGCASALPVLSNPVPQNSSYVGGGEQKFSVNVTNMLADHSERMRIKSRDSITWDTYGMTCTNEPVAVCICNVNLSLRIVGSDTTEVYYFEGNDSSGYGYLGTEQDPLTFTVDISPPQISFEKPANQSYVSGTEQIRLSVVDASSGVNTSSIFYSFDNSTWQSAPLSGDRYLAEFDTTAYANSQNITLYAKASDLVGNTAYRYINVTADNEKPRLAITEPQGGYVSGIVKMGIVANDSYSGTNTSSAAFKIGTVSKSMDCTGSGNATCEEYFDTRTISDGAYVLNFTVADNAGNYNSTTTQITVDNMQPGISFTSPTAYAHGISTVSVSLSITAAARLKIDSAWYNMSCSGTTCTYDWSTTAETDGQHQLFVNISGRTKLSNASMSVIVDNKKPALTINAPSISTVEGAIYPQVTVIDEIGVSSSTVVFAVLNSTYSRQFTTVCTEHLGGKKYFCSGNFNTTDFPPGAYILNFTAADLAGNYNSTPMEINIISTTPPTIPGGSYATTTTIPNSSTTNATATTTTLPSGTPVVLEVIVKGFSDSLPEGLRSSALMILVVLIAIPVFAVTAIIIFKYMRKPKTEGG